MNKYTRSFNILLWYIFIMCPSLINAARANNDTAVRCRDTVASISSCHGSPISNPSTINRTESIKL